MSQPADQLTLDVDYLLQHDHFLRVLKFLETRRESSISQLSAGVASNEALHQIAGELRAINETMAFLGYHKAKGIQGFKQL